MMKKYPKPKTLSKTTVTVEQWDDKTKIVFPCECSVTWATTRDNTEIIEHELCHHHGDLVHSMYPDPKVKRK